MIRRAIVLAIVASMATAAAALSAGQRATATNGLIAFSRYRTFVLDHPVQREIWVARPDGTGLRRLTHAPPNYLDTNPNWAPDGSRLVFTRCAPENGVANTDRCAIWTVNADGTRQRRLSPACSASTGPCPIEGGGGGPQYSPDGRLIAFDLDRTHGIIEDSAIVVSDTVLGHRRVVFTFGRKTGVPHVGSPTWSPDGARLAFGVTCCDQPTELTRGSAVYVVGIDGMGLHRVTPWRLEAGEPDWSPDGHSILFSSTTADNGDPGPAGGDLYTVRPDGSGLRQLTHLSPSDGVQLGSFSPNGKWIVFSSKAGARASSLGGEPRLWADVFAVRTDGTGLANVTKSTNWEGEPDWGP